MKTLATAEHFELDSDEGLQRIRVVTDDGDVIELGVTLDALVDLAKIGRTVDRYLESRPPGGPLRLVSAHHLDDPDENLRELADFLRDDRQESSLRPRPGETAAETLDRVIRSVKP